MVQTVLRLWWVLGILNPLSKITKFAFLQEDHDALRWPDESLILACSLQHSAANTRTDGIRVAHMVRFQHSILPKLGALAITDSISDHYKSFKFGDKGTQ